MALIPCEDCGRQISDLAVACPQCGRPANIDTLTAQKISPLEEKVDEPNVTSKTSESQTLDRNLKIDLAIKAALIRGEITTASVVDKQNSLTNYDEVVLRNQSSSILSKISMKRIEELNNDPNLWSQYNVSQVKQMSPQNFIEDEILEAAIRIALQRGELTSPLIVDRQKSNKTSDVFGAPNIHLRNSENGKIATVSLKRINEEIAKPLLGNDTGLNQDQQNNEHFPEENIPKSDLSGAKFCVNCGASLSISDVFCGQCGTSTSR